MVEWIYTWNQYPTQCGSIEVRGNQVDWTSASGGTGGVWDGGNCGVIAGWDDNDWSANLGPSIY